MLIKVSIIHVRLIRFITSFNKVKIPYNYSDFTSLKTTQIFVNITYQDSR